MGESRAELMVDLSDLRAELCDACEHVEPIRRRDRHGNRRLTSAWTTRQPGLLAQLVDLFAPSRTGSDENAKTVPRSRPPVYIDALSRHTAVTIAVARWVWSMGIEQQSTVEDNINVLCGSVENLDDETLLALRTEMRQWRTWAAVLTGWETPPWRPRVPCMIDECGRVGSIVVNLTREMAFCSACGAAWTPDTLGVLADYVRGLQDRANG